MENTDRKEASALLVPGTNEDSVDIYDGLDADIVGAAGKSPSDPARLQESMDLYEEIVTEEQRSRESSYAELKSRFLAAQNQIKELRRRLELMELQNTGLNTENHRLKKNISALLRTARQEVTRKDAEIQRLNQRSQKGHHHFPHVNNQRDPGASGHTDTGGTVSRPTLLPPPTPPPSSLPPAPPPQSSLPPPSLPTSSLLPAPPTPLLSSRAEHHKEPSSRGNDGSCNQSGGSGETRTSKSSSQGHPRSSSSGDRAADKQTSEPVVSKSGVSSSTRHSELDKHKSKHREDKYQGQRKSESSDRRRRTGSDPSRDSYVLEKNKHHKSDKNTGRRHESRSHKSRSYQNADGHHRPERSKSPLPETEISGSSEAKESCRDRRPSKPEVTASYSERGASRGSRDDHGRPHRKTKTGEGQGSSGIGHRHSDLKERKRSSSSQHAERRCDSPKEPPKGHQRKEESRREDEVPRKCKRSADDEKRASRDSCIEKPDIQGKELTQDGPKRSSEGTNTNKVFVEENSPNRKLCFMETLNLTISPVKKPTLPDFCRPGDGAGEEEPPETEADSRETQPNIEDMCVIDEVDGNDFDTDMGNDKEQATGFGESSVVLCKKNGDEEEARGRDGSKGDPPVTPKHRPENVPVQTALPPSQSRDVAEMAVQPSPEASEVNSLSVSNDDLICKERNISEVTTDKGRDAAPTSGCIQGAHTSNGERGTGHVLAVAESMELDSEAAAQQSVSSDNTTLSPAARDVNGKTEPPSRQPSPDVSCEEQPSLSSSTFPEDACCSQDSVRDAEAVSSTISLDSLPQEGLSLPEAIYVLTQTNDDDDDSSGNATDPSSTTGCIAVSKVSSTTEEKAPPEKFKDFLFTPKKSFSPMKSPKSNAEPSRSAPMLHDEDSMLRTLSSLKHIPDAISPLRSPIRIGKRGHLHPQGKPSHVKSLQKEFPAAAADTNSKKLDVNKENKYPGSPLKHDALDLVDKLSDLASSLSETELEEGEILSETDEASGNSPMLATKRERLVRSVRKKAFPKTVLSKKSEERASKETSEGSGGSSGSPGNRSRFKTVCPASTKVPFSSVDEVMETFKLVRSEIRKKYMKLHKTFPKKSFFGMMENFRESFLEFVDGAHFGKICSQAEELKTKLKTLIGSVFSKVANNGIVKRIFEQQAVDLKQKLWDFVHAQVDYLFKDIHFTLKSSCKPTRAAEGKKPSASEKVSRLPPAKKFQTQQKDAKPSPSSLKCVKPCAVVPLRTGLGSRGKDIRITHEEKGHLGLHASNADSKADFSSPKKPFSPEKNGITSVVFSQSSSLLDKTDFEILTEQQASSLTFNLVRDSQMGEIFKCLLQGSDLLETSGITGDSTAWSIGTPKKDRERLLSIATPTKFATPSKMFSPGKFDSPSKLIATWTSISPRKISSPSRDQIRICPALFDESCLLEVPSESQSVPQSSASLRRSYSLLAEDLAVSLTIPSPLKSDSHLSFLQPSTMSVLSTPESVISAHISEDALLDGEDATEQDIHLSLDTDNSSMGSNSSVASQAPGQAFVFKPDLPVQALIMERSNDHFILKIRQAATKADVPRAVESSLTQTLTGDNDDAASRESTVESNKSLKHASCHAAVSAEPSVLTLAECSGSCQSENGSLTVNKQAYYESTPPREGTSRHESEKPHQSPQRPPANRTLPDVESASSEGVPFVSDGMSGQTLQHQAIIPGLHDPSEKSLSPSKNPTQNNTEPAEAFTADRVSPSNVSESPRDDMEVPESDRGLTTAMDVSGTPKKRKRDRGKKRKLKRHRERSKAKRSRKEEDDWAEESSSLSPNSLSAMNVVKKKGAVVIAWTRDEDRAILMGLKANGASRETFTALAEKLEKPSGQIAHRFNQLMKLFKKQGKMDG